MNTFDAQSCRSPPSWVASEICLLLVCCSTRACVFLESMSVESTFQVLVQVTVVLIILSLQEKSVWISRYWRHPHWPVNITLEVKLDSLHSLLANWILQDFARVPIFACGSSFGNALYPTEHLVEGIFSILVITCGLLLFTMLIGNIQVSDFYFCMNHPEFGTWLTKFLQNSSWYVDSH